jgi:MSHA pilin protein MshD
MCTTNSRIGWSGSRGLPAKRFRSLRRGSRSTHVGTTLIELVVFIMIVSVAIAGVLIVIDRTARYSTDPLITKQALAIAESLLEEVQLMPFTYCDSDDANISTAISSLACATTTEALGPEVAQGETRYNAAFPFDNVNDYQGFAMSPIVDITNTAIGGVNAYTANVTVAATALGGIAANDANGQPNVLLITVMVSGPLGISVSLQGYRTKYAPTL